MRLQLHNIVNKYTFSAPIDIVRLVNDRDRYEMLFLDMFYGSKVEIELRASEGYRYGERAHLNPEQLADAEAWIKGQFTDGEWENLSECWDDLEERGRLVCYVEERRIR